jgi:hypothetical protein
MDARASSAAPFDVLHWVLTAAENRRTTYGQPI